MKRYNLLKQHDHLPAALAGFNTELLRGLPALMPSLRIAGTTLAREIGQLETSMVEVITPLGRKRRLFIEAMSAPVPSRVREAVRRLKTSVERQHQGYPMIASTFLSPRVREICKEEGVGYLDLAGNCFIRFEDLYLEKIVDRNPYPRRGRPPSLITPISSRVLRALLEEPERLWSVSELAQVATVSLGQVSNVTHRLLQEEYLVRSDRRLLLAHPAGLLELWREQYGRGAQIRLAKYSFEHDPEQLMTRIAEAAGKRRWDYALTSFAAASLIAPYVRGIGVVEWYVRANDVDGWIETLGLRPVEAGANTILATPHDPGVLYRRQSIRGLTVVGNVQLYLDLYIESSRGQEQAEFLRKTSMRF